MFYQFRCNEHGEFEVEQPLLAEHKATCPECGKEGQRIFSQLQWKWANSVFRPDGSYRQDDDYAILKG